MREQSRQLGKAREQYINIQNPNPARRTISEYSPTADEMDPGSFLCQGEKVLPDRGTDSTFKVPLAPLLVTVVPPYDLV